MKWFLSGFLICWACAVPNALAANMPQNEWTGPNGTLLKEQFELIQKKLDSLQDAVNELGKKQKELEAKMSEDHQQIRYWIHKR